VRGETHHGKSSVAREFAPAATKVIALDSFVYRISVSKFQHGAVPPSIKANFKANDLTALYKGIDEAGLTDEYAALIAQSVAPSDRSVIIEGLMTDAQVEALTARLKGRAVIWDATRQFPKQ
jgi:hypothetical protein